MRQVINGQLIYTNYFTLNNQVTLTGFKEGSGWNLPLG